MNSNIFIKWNGILNEKLLLWATTGMSLINIILNKRIQKQRKIHCMILFTKVEKKKGKNQS